MTYLCYVATFFLGNHDFHFVRYGMSVTAGVFEGRFSQFLPPYLLTLGHILPVLNVWFGFLFLSAGVVLLAKWYGFREKTYDVVFFGLLIVLNPYFLTQFYYVHLVLSFCFWHFLSIVGVILIYEGVNRQKWRIWAGVLCLVLCFGGYASSLELVAVVLLGKMWLEILSGRKVDRKFLMFYLQVGGACALALFIYMGIIEFLKVYRLLSSVMYNVRTLSFREIWQRFLFKWDEPFKVLASSLPMFGGEVLVAEGVLSVLALLTGKFKKRLLFSFVFIIGLVYAAFLTSFVSSYDFFYIYRVHCYSVPYVFAVLFAIVWQKGNKWLRNVALVGTCLLLNSFLLADFETQKIWYLGNTQDEKMIERVRQEIFPRLQKGKHYRLATLGDIAGGFKLLSLRDKNISPELRERYREFYTVEYYLPIYFSNGLFLYEDENPIWGDALRIGFDFFYGLLNERVALKDKISAHIFSRSFGEDKDEMLSALSQMRSYPHPNYYFIGQKDIFLMFENGMADRDALVAKLRTSMH